MNVTVRQDPPVAPPPEYHVDLRFTLDEARRFRAVLGNIADMAVGNALKGALFQPPYQQDCVSTCTETTKMLLDIANAVLEQLPEDD